MTASCGRLYLSACPFLPQQGPGYPRLLSPSFPPDLRRFGPLDLSTRKKGRTPGRCLPPRKHRTRRAGRWYRSQRRFWQSGTQYRCGSQPKLQKNQGVPKVHPWYRGGESILSSAINAAMLGLKSGARNIEFWFKRFLMNIVRYWAQKKSGPFWFSVAIKSAQRMWPACCGTWVWRAFVLQPSMITEKYRN